MEPGAPDLTRPRDVRGLLNRYGVRLSRELGQHLLVDREVLQRIVAAADLTPRTEVLEVGPGVGALTAELSRAAGRVVAVELDRRLVDLLRETVPSPTVEVIQGDALQANLPSLFQGRPYRVVANLPYNVATPLIRRLLYTPPAARPELLVLMVQREVGRRF
ncbi:MAG TPA: rRNA adenine dimethyltransferase family protein, partial [Chloroflexota bacterium]|nr:rRNA adenine dimethyltransferase family protein [Chloroflexota bacterium]